MIRAYLRYFFTQAYGALSRSAWTSLLTISTICLALLIPALYVMTMQNLESLTLVWGRSANVVLVLHGDPSQNETHELVEDILAQKGVSKARVISPEQALTKFRNRGPKAAALVEGVHHDILPFTIQIQLEHGFAHLDQIETMAQKMSKMKGVAEVDYGQDEFEQLEELIQGMRYGGIAVGLLLFFTTAFIVGNTIRLNVYAHRDEIVILRLVGATHWFVRAPFLIEGAVWGTGGGLTAAGLLWVFQQFGAPELAHALADSIAGMDLVFFTPSAAIVMVSVGVLLGTFGSALAVRRFLEQNPS